MGNLDRVEITRTVWQTSPVWEWLGDELLKAIQQHNLNRVHSVKVSTNVFVVGHPGGVGWDMEIEGVREMPYDS